MAPITPEQIGEDQVVFPGEDGPNTWGKEMMLRRFQDPNRNDPDDFWLFHSKKVASIVLPVTTDMKVVAIRIFAQAANKPILQIPGGVPKKSESFEAAALREVQEEIGHKVDQLDSLGIGWFEPFNTTTPFQAFLATGCTAMADVSARLDSTEYLEVETYPWEEWWKMCLNGTIEDAKSVLITARGLARLNLI